jgi:putative thioredoxin
MRPTAPNQGAGVSLEVSDFDREVLERSKSTPVLVDFWAEWCAPCRVLGPILERLAAEAAGRWILAKVDVEAHPDIAAAYDVASIPNVKLFADGRTVGEFVGLLPEPEVRGWLGRALPSPLAGEVAAARALLDQARWPEAVHRLRAVVGAEPANRAARIALAEALLHTTPRDVEPALLDLADDFDLGDRVDALRTLARLALLLEDPSALPEAPEKARLLDGLQAIRAGDWAAALEAFIDVLRRSRDYAGGAARQGGRAVFVLLGHGHPVTDRFHRAFSGALHV